VGSDFSYYQWCTNTFTGQGRGFFYQTIMAIIMCYGIITLCKHHAMWKVEKAESAYNLHRVFYNYTAEITFIYRRSAKTGTPFLATFEQQKT
jgi:hypothetical protein